MPGTTGNSGRPPFRFDPSDVDTDDEQSDNHRGKSSKKGNAAEEVTDPAIPETEVPAYPPFKSRQQHTNADEKGIVNMILYIACFVCSFFAINVGW